MKKIKSRFVWCPVGTFGVKFFVSPLECRNFAPIKASLPKVGLDGIFAATVRGLIRSCAAYQNHI